MPSTSAAAASPGVARRRARPRRSSGASSAAGALGRERGGDPQALGVELLAAAEPDDQRPRRPLGMQERELLERRLDVAAPRASRELGRQLVAVGERDRDHVGVELGERPADATSNSTAASL